jgi:uncharacterized membrane protein
LVTRERERTTNAAGGGPGKPPPPRGRRREWWRDLPPPFNRPRPINRRNVIRGGLVAIPFLVIVDGLLGAMAWYATANAVVGWAVFSVTFLFTLGEVAVVAWAANRRQLEEQRRAREQD